MENLGTVADSRYTGFGEIMDRDVLDLDRDVLDLHCIYIYIYMSVLS